MSARATDAEIATLAPIIEDLVELLEPHVAARAYRAARAHGAIIRTLILPEVDVDVVALARYVAARGGAAAKVLDLHADDPQDG